MMTTLLDLTDTALPKGKVKVPPRKAATRTISVNGVAISEEAVRAEAQNHPAKTPNAAFEAAARALVVRELLMQEARAKQVVVAPRDMGTDVRETDDDAAIRALLEEDVSTPQADDAACFRYYAAHGNKFRSETLYEARHILIAAAETDTEARARANVEAAALIEELKTAPERFAELAASHSACPSKAQGGSLGQLTSGSTVPEFESALAALSAGELSAQPVATRFGYHIIRLDRIIAGEQVPFEAVKERIAGWLEASSWSRAVAQYIGILAGKAEIVGVSLDVADGPLVQ